MLSERDYRSRLSDDSKKKRIFDVVWTSVSAININAYEHDYKVAYSTSNLTDLKSLSSSLDTEISICENLRKSYPKNQDAVQAAIDMKSELLSLKCKVDKNVAFLEGKTLSSKVPLIQKVSSFRRTFTRVSQPINDFGDKVASGYKKFSKPAENVFNFGEDVSENGSSDLIKGINSLFGTNKKK